MHLCLLLFSTNLGCSQVTEMMLPGAKEVAPISAFYLYDWAWDAMM